MERHFGNASLKDLPWDSDYFDVPSQRIELDGPVKRSDLLSLKAVCDATFLTIINKGNINENNVILPSVFSSNIFLADVNVVFVSVVFDRSPHSETCRILEREEKSLYLKQLKKLASESFVYSRFFNDPFLNDTKKHNVYSHWVETSLEHKSFLCYFDTLGSIYGFILFSLSGTDCVIELIAVGKEHQHHSVGTMLMDSLFSYCSGHSIRRILVGTQVNNLKAIRFYIKNSFKPFEINSIYHYWRNDEN